jgi:N-acetylneuraminic acid mutarotase
VINGQLYVAGGGTGNDAGPATYDGRLDMYDPTTNSWTTLTSMPLPVVYATGAVVNGKLYVFGGQIDGQSTITSTVQVFDPLTNTWSYDTPMPTGLSNSAAAVYGNTVYLFGGDSSSTIVEAMTVPEPATICLLGLGALSLIHRKK